MLRAAGGHLMRVLDLFSGIGGMSLGLQRAGMTTVAFCEIDPFCRRVLAKHWPEVPIYDDVRSLTAARLAADGIVFDLICGGFPCQDLSVAGRGAGLSGERSGLWFEFCRIIEETRPGWTLIENVPALRSRGLDIVLGGLAALGYDAEWHCIPAAAVGAPHRRDRIWIVSYTHRRCGDIGSSVSGNGREVPPEGLVGIVRGGDVCEDVADAVCAEPSHRDAEPLWPGRTQVDAERRGGGSDVALAAGEGLPPSEREVVRGTGRRDEGGAASECRGWGLVPLLGGVVDGSAAGLDGVGGGLIAPSSATIWAEEPDIPRVAIGVPNRVARLKALGNGVVPQIPELIGRAIMARQGAVA